MENYEELIKALREYCVRRCPLEEKAGICGNHDAKKSADAIEELVGRFHMMKKTAEWLGEKVPRWISVKERLPEKPMNYPDCEIRQCYFLVALDSTAVISCGYDFDKKRWHHGYIVTHWMPLPAPPEGEAE